MGIRKKETPKPCQHCGKIMRRKNYNGVLESNNIFKRRKYCDLKCSSLAHRKKNPTRSAYLKRVEKLRDKSCQNCGAVEHLSTHHINGNWRDNKPENLATLCSSCHTSLHHEQGDIVQQQPPKPCRICGKPSERADLCGKHRQRKRKYGDPLLTKRNFNGQWKLVSQV